VIRADQVDPSGQQFCPQRLAGTGVADGWRTFQRRTDALEVFLAEREIVRACLGRDRYALVPRRIDLRQPFRAAHMHDMRAHALTGAAHADEEPANRIDFGRGGSGPAPRQRTRRALGLEHLLAFGVYADDRVEPGSDFQSDREYAVRYPVKVLDAAVTHECFEADYAPLVEGLEVVEVVGDKAAPEAEIDEGLL